MKIRWCAASWALVLLGGCTGSSPHSPVATSTGSVVGDVTSTTGGRVEQTAIARAPAPSPEAAVSALLRAEEALDHRTSFALLSSAGLEAYPSIEAWSRRQTDLANVIGFRRESVTGTDVMMLVEHKAGIDAFVGLQFAKEHQTWHTRKESGGWLVDPDPKIEPVVPADTGAGAAALRWVAAQQSCDRAAVVRLQAIPELHGVSAGAAQLCHARGSAAVVASAPARPGPQTAELVAQYGSGVLPFVRRVSITGLTKPFDLLLVPIGEAWSVIAVGEGDN